MHMSMRKSFYIAAALCKRPAAWGSFGQTGADASGPETRESVLDLEIDHRYLTSKSSFCLSVTGDTQSTDKV